MLAQSFYHNGTLFELGDKVELTDGTQGNLAMIQSREPYEPLISLPDGRLKPCPISKIVRRIKRSTAAITPF